MGNKNAISFRDATRQQCKASIMIEGLSGKGKSGLALVLAKALSGNDMQKVYAVDTENKSLDLFQGIRMHDGDIIEPFKKADLLKQFGYAPTNYLIGKEMAIQNGGEVCILDSISHMWQKSGGVLDIVNKVTAKSNSKNKYIAWGDPEVLEEKNAIIECIRDSHIHMITTVRIKEAYVMEEGADGKNQIVAKGEQQQQMPDLKYEPDLLLHMTQAGNEDGTPPKAIVLKSRYSIFKDGVEYSFTESLLNSLVEYLQDGADPAELIEKQRLEIVVVISELLDNNPSKKTIFEPIKKNLNIDKDMKLKEMTLDNLRILLSALTN